MDMKGDDLLLARVYLSNGVVHADVFWRSRGCAELEEALVDIVAKEIAPSDVEAMTMRRELYEG